MEKRRYYYLKDCDILFYIYYNVMWIIIPSKGNNDHCFFYDQRTYYIKISFFSISKIPIKKNLGNLTVKNIVKYLLSRRDYNAIQGISKSTVKGLYGELMK